MSTSQNGNAKEDRQTFLEALAAELPPFIARTEVASYLGGIVTGKTLSNADTKGIGPKVAYAVGRKVVYSREALIAWLGENFSIQRLAGSIKNV